jgi:hypothetical protein
MAENGISNYKPEYSYEVEQFCSIVAGILTNVIINYQNNSKNIESRGESNDESGTLFAG